MIEPSRIKTKRIFGVLVYIVEETIFPDIESAYIFATADYEYKAAVRFLKEALDSH